MGLVISIRDPFSRVRACVQERGKGPPASAPGVDQLVDVRYRSELDARERTVRSYDQGKQAVHGALALREKGISSRLGCILCDSLASGVDSIHSIL